CWQACERAEGCAGFNEFSEAVIWECDGPTLNVPKRVTFRMGHPGVVGHDINGIRIGENSGRAGVAGRVRWLLPVAWSGGIRRPDCARRTHAAGPRRQAAMGEQ